MAQCYEITDEMLRKNDILEGEPFSKYEERLRVLYKIKKKIYQMRYPYKDDAVLFCKKLGFIYKDISKVLCSVKCGYQVDIECEGPYGQKVYINLDEDRVFIYQYNVKRRQKVLSKNNPDHFRILEEMDYKINSYGTM